MYAGYPRVPSNDRGGCEMQVGAGNGSVWCGGQGRACRRECERGGHYMLVDVEDEGSTDVEGNQDTRGDEG
jgi:hypothetical protein